MEGDHHLVYSFVRRTNNTRGAATRLQPGIDLTKALARAAELEDEETIRKLDLRK